MRHAEVVGMEEISTGKTHPHKVLLERDGIRMHAVFRDYELSRERIRIRDRFHMFFRDSAIFEGAAYALSRALRIYLVPPTVVRSIDGRRGTLQVWIENVMTDADRREQGLQPPDPRQWFLRTQMINVWDQLIFNDDRNPGNILVDGSWNLWLIDHTRAFQRNPRIRDPEMVSHCERRLWNRLREIEDSEIRDAVREYLSPAEVEDLLERRRRLVQRITELIEERGEEAVIYDLPR